MNFLLRMTKYLNRWLMFIGGLFFLGMIILTCANIFVRQVYMPVRGTFELMGYAGAVVTAFALGYTQSAKGHIAVDILFNIYPQRLKKIVLMLNHGICCVFFVLTAWHVVQKALILKNSGEISETLRILYYPFTLAVALGCFGLALTLFADFLKTIWPEKEGAQ